MTTPRQLNRPELVAFLNAQGCVVLNDKHDNIIVVLPDRLVMKADEVERGHRPRGTTSP